MSLVAPHVTSSTLRGTITASSPVAAAAAKSAPAPPRFTAEETILLRGLASGATSKEMAAQMRLPRESLYRLIGDLRRKTGASSDAALAVWVLRNMSSGAGERRDGSR
jgi:DNA-binding CsgD family transcriptional regulator